MGIAAMFAQLEEAVLAGVDILAKVTPRGPQFLAGFRPAR